jgi:gliding motility-associated-like protein
VDVGPGTGTVISQLYVYRNTIILNGVCADWRFSYTCGGCRNPTTNVVGFPTYYIEVLLNNTLGPNSSPIFVSEPVRAFCINRPFNWQQNSIEFDGDSLRFDLTSPLQGPNNNGVPFQPAFSAQQPFATTPPQSLSVNRASGIFSFTLGTTGNYACAIKIDEYRFDSINNGWVLIGNSVRDMQITVATNCNNSAQAGVTLNQNAPGMYIDPVTGLPTVDYSCQDSLITMFFAVAIDCFSISPDGTDFRLTDPNGDPVPIRSLIPNCDNDNATQTIQVDLYHPFRVNGTYFIYSKVGTDGNTLFNKCGFDMQEFDTIAINVTGCFDPQLNIENVTIFENQYPIAQWAVDTSTFPTADFNAYEVFRSDAGGPFVMVGTVTNLMQWEFEDQSGVPQVNTDNYQYRIRPIIRGRNFGDTRSIVSILLKSDFAGMDTNIQNLTWNAYDGWVNPEYHVMLGLPDGAGGFNFSLHTQPGSIVTNQNWFNFKGPEEPGQYAIRVDAHNPTNNTWIAQSNWILFGVLPPPIPPVIPPDELIIPNVFTPNGDGVNDRFEIKGIESYASGEVAIFSRWGQKVYETTNYSNGNPWEGTDMSGNKLADGVYFYVIKLNNQATLQLEEYKGTVTISRGGL